MSKYKGRFSEVKRGTIEEEGGNYVKGKGALVKVELVPLRFE